MKTLKMTTRLMAVALILTGLLAAKTNKYGVADVRRLTLTAPTRVGDVLLPEGQYEVRHVMEEENHIMVFKQLGTDRRVEVRTKCNLVSLKEKADRDELSYGLNAAGERVLQRLQFKGDLAEHVF
jgi:hypothetical protein